MYLQYGGAEGATGGVATEELQQKDRFDCTNVSNTLVLSDTLKQSTVLHGKAPDPTQHFNAFDSLMDELSQPKERRQRQIKPGDVLTEDIDVSRGDKNVTETISDWGDHVDKTVDLEKAQSILTSKTTHRRLSLTSKDRDNILMPPPESTPGTSGLKRNQDARSPQDEFQTYQSKSAKKKAKKKEREEAREAAIQKNQITNYLSPGSKIKPQSKVPKPTQATKKAGARK